MKIKIKSIFAICSALLAGTACAAGFYGNQSDIKWKTAGTEHFQFIYPVEYSTHAAKVSAYAEAVYDSVTSRYSKPLPRINAVLNNALYSNGSAIPSENALNLWLTNWDFKIRSSHGWISDVVTHEFSHLVSIESGAKIVPNLYGFQFSYTDYYNERTRSDFLTMIPFTLQPLWLAEGTAQYESSRMGFDAWDTHRDMLLRTAALNDSLMTLPYMHDFSDNSLLAELGPYTQGFSLVLYIAKHYGDDAIPKIWHELGKPYRATLNGAIKSVLGISEQQLYDDWKKEITEYYQAQKDSLGTLVEGIKITKDAFWQDFPVVSGKNLYGISNFGGPWFDGSVFKIPLEDTLKTSDSTTADSAKVAESKSTDSTKVEVGDIEVEGADSTLINIADFAKSGFKAKKPWFDKGIDIFDDSTHGPILTYISYQNRDKDGHAHFDVAVSDTNKNEVALTYLVDAVYPSFNKQGTSIVFARRDAFSTRFRLSKIPFSSDLKKASSEEPIDVFIPDSSLLYYNIYSPKFSPDGKRIAFSFFDDVQRGIAVIDTNGANFKVVSTTGYDERDVNWIDNDKIIFASNRNNIFNLIEKDLKTGKERALTNVIGGAFTPTLANDTIFFTQYDKDGFSLYKLPYAKEAEPIFRDSVVVTVRDSVLQKADTIQVACADTTQATDSTKCTQVVLHKDVIQVEQRDTIKVAVKDTTLREIILHGTLPQKPHKGLELIDREFAGAERNYKPIPNTPLFVPIFSISENAPSLTVFGEGEMKAKLGVAVVISDPLKKNTVQLGLLLELGKGINYINGDGLNPKQEKEFFIAWDNHSTPLDLGVSYSYANYTNKDTVRYEDVGAHGGDSIGTTHYAYATQAITGTAGYSIFKSIDTLQAAISYDWANVNFYDERIEWTYQKRFSATIGLGLYGDHEGESGSGISGQGNGLFAYYQYANSDLSRPGSLYVTENGRIESHYRNFTLHQFGLNLYGSVQTPFLHARLAAGGKLTTFFWNTDDVVDTLDSYYLTPVFLDGYPYLRSNEDYTLAGIKTAMAELHYLYPIYDDWRNNLWIFSTRSLYVDLFAQIGAAWDGKFWTSKLTKHEFWDRSVGLSFRMSNKIWDNIPFDISLTLARGLSRIGEDKDLRGGTKLKPIDLPLLHKNICPTRIKFSIGMGFVNSWQ
ncbi:hypothetical protein [Fibrobacter sp. UWB13]|uniref:hypothetical protein n=1 Tax=Fibrobacter sp. UWB13 TaxID=1896204 RepID=UPI000A0B44F9|nr:hypothetical protein [Fibrobacter sp. UWB13]SMG20518.1 hypothetical protein SAMN05720489_1297 [Fibrobacter sp. UWB13]